MDYENLCMYCFKESDGASICPHCGKDARAAVPQIQMLPGTQVHRERFLIGRALGQDANGVVYNALDTRRGGVIRIREYLPRNCAERLNDGGVVPIAGMEDAFETGMRKLRASVESVEDPKKRHFYFEENGTAYIAQRKNAKGTPMPDEDEMDEDEDRRRPSAALYVVIAAAVVVAVAIAIIWFLSSMSEPEDVTTIQPLQTVSAEATWKPQQTPTPTPYATATFAALVDPELSWMDYTYDGDVEKEYQQQQATVQNTKKPTIITDDDYDTISSSSSSASVRELQQRLASLGWMEYYDVTGKYDSDTRNAVKAFQTYVNEYCSPAKKLTVDGIAGEKTQQWLYNASVSLTRPTPTPKPLVTAAPDSSVINANSPRSQIRMLQHQLITLGLLPEGSADGSFGSATRSAVKSFQIRVNQLQGYNALDVDGVVDELTQAYLEYYVNEWLDRKEEEESKPTATPKPTDAPTASPTPETGVINSSSSEIEIAFVQEMLVNIGLLDTWDVDGVYGRGTVNAVKIFQKWVNELRGTETLEVSGECDLLTQQYLQYCIDKGMSPVQPSPSPSPTAEPKPEIDENNTVVDASSDAESVAFVQEMLAGVGLLENGDVDGDYGSRTTRAVKNFQRFVNSYYGTEKVQVTGVCDSDTLQYLEYAYENGWNLGEAIEPEAPTQKPTQAPTKEPESGYEVINGSSSKKKVRAVQEMLSGVGLINPDDVDGGYGKKTINAVKTLQQFVNDQKGETILSVTGECDPLTLQYLEYCYEEGWNLGEILAPEETEPPYVEPEATEAPAEPELGNVRGFEVEVDGRGADGSLIELGSGKHSISWSADSGVESFFVYLYDGDGSLINSMNKSGAGEISVKASDLKAGEIYRLEIGALPFNGGEDDVIWQTIKITRYSEPEEEATPEPTEIPEPEVARVSKPSISIGSPAHQEDGVPWISGDTVIFSWQSEGDVEYYNATLTYEDGTEYSLGNTTDTSKTVSAEQLQSGRWRLTVGAMPVGGSEDDMKWNEFYFGVPEAEEEEAPEMPEVDVDERIEYIDEFSPAENIQLVQMALYRHGLLNPDDTQIGVLDEMTLNALIQFQTRVNELYGAELQLIDPVNDELIFIDQPTLECLLYMEIDLKG